MANYHGGKDSLYEILAVHRNATAKDVGLAYRRLKAAAEKEGAPPARLALLHEAHEVLSDPQKRAAYDASLKSDDFLRPAERQRRPFPVGPLVGVAVAVFVALWFVFRSGGPADRIPSEIIAAAAPSVGRVNVIDIQGRATPQANAFAIDKGVMLTTCQGFRANTQVVVRFGPRSAPASVSRSEPKRNLCRLAVMNAGSWPLGVNTAPPQPGDTAYAASISVGGETSLVRVKVRGLLAAEGAQWIELADRVEPEQAGGPLLDTQGRVIGVLTTQHAFAGKQLAMPAAWVQEIRAAPVR